MAYDLCEHTVGVNEHLGLFWYKTANRSKTIFLPSKQMFGVAVGANVVYIPTKHQHGVKNTGVDTSPLCRSKNATSQFNRSVSLQIAYGGRPPGYTHGAAGYVDRK